jgi:hypothetical protein
MYVFNLLPRTMKNIRHLMKILITLVTTRPIMAQSLNVKKTQLIERLHSLSSGVSPELAYNQSSEDIYESGKELWFKVYLLDAQYLIHSKLIKTLYTQLLKETTRKIVWHE